MANNRIQIKRTSVSGRAANTVTLTNPGELALNMADGILYSTNGSSVFEIGANLTNSRVTGSLTIDNNKSLRFTTVNTSVAASFIQQSDDNFVLYTTNASYGQRPVFSIYANSSTSPLSVAVPVNFNANIGVLTANGSAGATNQVLTSNGSTVYWSSPGAATINTSAQYTWSNLHTFSANVSFTGNNINLTSNTGSILFAGSTDTNWRIGRNTGATTKFYYSNNTMDIIAAASNLEGFVIGQPGGNTYLETGYAGTFTKNPIYVGNASVNVTINSTSFSGTANNSSYLNGKTEVNLNVNNALTANNSSYLNAKTESNLNVNNALTSNNSSYLNGKTESNLNVNSAINANSANNSAFLGGFDAAFYVKNTDSRTLSGNLVISGTYFNPTSNTILLGNSTQRWVISGNSADFSSSVNAASFNVGTSYTVNTTAIYFGTINATSNGIVVNATSFVIGNSTVNSSINSTTFSGTANNASNLGGVAAANFVQNNDSRTLSGNLNFTAANVYFTSGLKSGANIILSTTGLNIGNSTVNASSNSSSLTIANSTANTIVNIGSISLSGQTINSTAYTGLSYYVLANSGIVSNSFGVFVNTAYIATLNANNTTYVNGKTESNLNVNSALIANNSSYLGGVAAASYVQNTDSRVLSGNINFSAANVYYDSGIFVGANVVVNTSTIFVGNSTVNTNISAGAIATNNITLRANGYIDFNTTTYKPSWQTGRLYYDNEEKTWIGYGDGTSFEISIGQREWVRCRNSSGATIAKGKPVYITGVHISGDPVHGHHPTIALADASDVNKKDVLGLAGEDILDGLHGYVVVRGYIEGLDTSNLTQGQRIHLGFSAPGVLQTPAPEYPNWPMDVGVCLTSNSTVGTIYVNINDHSLERLRVQYDAVVGGDLTVAGDLFITGNVVTTSTTNINTADNILYLGAGDTISPSGTTFTGSGLNDFTFHGVFEGTSSTTYYVKIFSVGATDTFAWSKDNFATTIASNIAITGGFQALDNGITIKFQATTGHTLNDKWSGTAAPVNVDLGWAGNYNDGTYQHAGMFRDATDGKFKFFEGYIPEPSAAVNIDTNHASFRLANVTAHSIFANLVGTSNNTTYAFGKTEINLNVNSAINSNTANNSSYLGGIAAASYVQNTDSRTLSGNLYFTGTNNYFGTAVYVGANVSVNTSAVKVGTSTRDSFATQTTGTTGQIVDSWLFGSYRSAKYTLSVKNNNANGFMLSEMLVLFDSVNPQTTEYGIVISNNSLGTFSANSNTTHVRLTFTPTSTNTTITGDRLLIAV